MKAIYKRELQGYFYSLSGYVYLFIFSAMSAVFYGVGNLADYSGNMPLLLRNMSYLWMLTTPILTSRAFAGEKANHTDLLLFSSPNGTASIVAGKYFALLTVLCIAVALSFVFPLITALYGTLYLAETAVAYLGFFLQGACFLALDLFLSTLFSGQISAAVFAFGVNLLFWILDAVSSALKGSLVSEILDFISLNQRLTPFTLGQLSFANTLYSLFFIFLFLRMAVFALDEFMQR